MAASIDYKGNLNRADFKWQLVNTHKAMSLNDSVALLNIQNPGCIQNLLITSLKYV